MNWGTKITLAFVLFMIFILYMVVIAFQQNFDLVSDDYYAQEIAYQQKIKQKSNLANSNSRVKVTQESELVVLDFPEMHNPNGEVYFYHPSQKNLDRKFTIAADIENSMVVKKANMIPGNYRINITWTSEGEEFFQQEQIRIQ